MSKEAENIALFDRYLRNEMSTDERVSFEAQLTENKTLKADFEAFQMLEKAIEDQEIIEFKERLKEWDAVPTEKKGRIISLPKIAIAATLIALIGITSFFYFKKPSNAELVASNFKPYDNVMTIRGEKEDIDDGLRHYEQKEYTKAIAQFEQYTHNENASFYLAESYMALEQYDDAILAYNSVIQLDNIFSEVATFHLALAHLGNNNSEEAIQILKTIKENSDYHEAALSVLDDLE